MIEQSVPKPSTRMDATDDDIGEVIPVGDREPKGDGFGTSEPSSVAEACKRAQEAGVGIVVDLGVALTHGDRRKVLTTFRRTLSPQ
jgi:hypothetical protein